MSDRSDLAAKLVALEAQMAAADKRAAELESRLAGIVEAGKPPTPMPREPVAPIDYTAGVHIMPKEVMRDLASAIPDSLARDLRADVARGSPIHASTSMIPDRGGQPQVERGSGYRDAVPLGPVSGLPIMDAMMDRQDEIDKADLARRLARAAKQEKG
jgi:hypothetical protein